MFNLRCRIKRKVTKKEKKKKKTGATNEKELRKKKKHTVSITIKTLGKDKSQKHGFNLPLR
jgi:hypothetical protein